MFLILSKFKKFLRLSLSEKKFFLEAFCFLGLMRAAILTIPFKRLTASLQHLPQVGEMPLLSPREYATVCAVRAGIRLAVSQTPWESACLVQSFTAQKMLQRRGVSGVFFLGVRKKAHVETPVTTGGDMDAHAWSQCGDVVISGDSGSETFAIISVFVWEGK